MTEQDIIKLRKSIADRKREIAEQQGKRTAKMESLQSEYNVETLEAGEALVTSLEEQIETDTKELAEEVIQLKALQEEMK